MHKTDSAFEYYKHYITMKDILQSDQLKGKFAAYNYEQTIALLDKEKQLQQQQLQQSAQQRIFLIIGITGILFLGIIILRNTFLKRKNEKNLREIAENELQLERVVSEKKLSELEMQALRAQMNPHFIFNSLNSINRFILKNNKDQASEYLTKFSKLVRLILQNSNSALITLESELEALQLYLELESLRFNHRFNFKISVDDDLDPEVIKVPPLIIQPYAENAIWHGLMQKIDIGKLEIEISEQLDLLKIKISDDGIGRKKAAELKSKSATTHKSMGLKITKDRIMMMDKTENREAVVINDVVHPDGSAAGTEVIIKIPITYDKSNSY
jgi:LytS/YehU family sensor histidine kinase